MCERVKTFKNIAIIIVAAGSGARYGGSVPKQFEMLHGKPVFVHSVQRFQRYFPEATILLVTRPDVAEYVGAQWLNTVQVVEGGQTRQASVKNGLEALQDTAPEVVLVHDAARPFVSHAACERLLEALSNYDGAIASLPVTNTIQQVDGDIITDTLNRDALFAAQTPQAFHYDALLSAHEQMAGNFTDDAGIMRAAGFRVCTALGDEQMFKITTQKDMQRAQAMMQTELRIGQGYDVHQFTDFATGEAQTMKLGGVDVPHTRRLKGHSDADVVLHAITDALLGAIGQGDIGQYFPPSNDAFKNMDSELFVAHALKLLHEVSGAVNNCDVTIIGERPKIGSVRDHMRHNIARILNCGASRVNVKATTTEKLGFEGKEEGLACSAIISVTVLSENDKLAP